MEKIPLIFMAKVPDTSKAAEHEQAVAHFERHRDLYQQYAGHSITIMPAPSDVDTFAFNLETNTIYLNDKFYTLLAYPEVATAFATFHEIEHFREKLALLKEPNGAVVFKKYLDQLDTKLSPKAEAYGVMDNCLSDVRQNGAVISRTPESFVAIERDLYEQVQFPNVDFTSTGDVQPLHIQLPYAILNEYRTGRPCTVDPRVRAIIDSLQHTTLQNGKVMDLLAAMTESDPAKVSMSKRLALQDAYVWPRILELLDIDIEEKNNQPKPAPSEPEASGEPAADTPSEQPQSPEPGGESMPADEKPDGGGEPNADDPSGETPGQEQTSTPNPGEGYPANKPGSGESPNDMFSKAYAEATKRVPNAVSINDQRKALKEWIAENGDPEKKRNKEIAERLGVKIEDLRTYQRIAAAVNKINPETHESAIDELESIIKRIISQRLKLKQAPKYDRDEGDELVDPASWVAEVEAGNLSPKVWENNEPKLLRDKKFGEVEITLVCDRSSSMAGEKIREQQKAVGLFMEALKRFHDALEEAETDIETPLSISSEVFSFQANAQDTVAIKKMSPLLTEKERILSVAAVGSASPNSTTDFVTLGAINQGMKKETIEKIQLGELKKIVIVFTDGESDDTSQVTRILSELRLKDVVVIGVGITESGSPVLTTYAPEAVVANRAEDLPSVLAQILHKHLDGV